MNNVKVRVIYSKLGPVRFISHLDLMRTIFRGFIRADIPISLSQGFSPHQQIAFGPPLSVGMEGENEFFDFEPSKFCDLKKIKDSLKYSLYNILDIKEIHYFDRSRDITVRDIDQYEYDVFLGGEFKSAGADIDNFLSRKEIIAERITPERIRKVDLRPLIKNMRLAGGGAGLILSLELCSKNGQFASPYDIVRVLFSLDEPGARGFRVRRKNMFSTTKGLGIRP